MFSASSRIEVLGFVPQSENLRNLLLVKGNRTDFESVNLLNNIKEQLYRSVLLNLWGENGVQIWCLRLQRYIDIYGWSFSKEDHIGFVKLLYDALTCTRQDLCCTEILINTLIQLLKKLKLLSPKELLLPWRPLYNICDELFFTKKIFSKKYNSEKLKTRMRKLALLVNNYFAEESTQEIFEMVSPMLCPFSCKDITEALTKLEWFLPTSYLVFNHHNKWFDVLISLWEGCSNEVYWEEILMKLFARCAKDNIGEIDWEPYVSIFYSKIIRTMKLPSRHGTLPSKRTYLKPESCALWVISSLDNKGSGKCAFFTLLSLFSSYSQPSNEGPWTSWMCKMILELSACLVKRIKCEQNEKMNWMHQVPASHKLSEEYISKCVKSLLDVVIDALSANVIEPITLHHLAVLNPALVVPRILELISSSQDHTTEPRMYFCAIECLNAVAQALVEGVYNGNTDGAEQIFDILFVCIQHIDASNYTKSLKTLSCVAHVLSLIPLMSYDEVPESAKLNICVRKLVEQYRRAEDIIIELLDRCFRLILNIESAGNTNFQVLEQYISDSLHRQLNNLMNSFTSHLSPKLFKIFLEKVKLFVLSRTLDSDGSAGLTASMCGILSKINPEETIQYFWPELARTILSMIGKDGQIGEDSLEQEISYYLLIISEIIDCGCGSWGTYFDELCEILDRTLISPIRRIVKLSSNILRSAFRSLSCISIKNNFENYFNYKSPVMDFGLLRTIDELKIEWNTPNCNVKKIHVLMNKYVTPSLEYIEGLLDNTVVFKRDHLHSRLQIIDAALESDNLSSFTSEPFLILDDGCSEFAKFTFNSDTDEYNIYLPNGDSLHDCVLRTVSKLQDYISVYQDDDTESFNIIIKIWTKLLIRDSSADVLQCEVNAVKKRIKNPLREKSLGKHINYQLLKIRLLTSLRCHYSALLITKSHVEVLKYLLKLCFCGYRTIRDAARASVFEAAHLQWSISSIVMMAVSEYIEQNESLSKGAFEGIIQILQGPKNSPIINYYDLEAYLILLPQLVSLKPVEEESLSSLNQIETVMNKRNLPGLIFSSIVAKETLKKSALSFGCTMKITKIPSDYFLSKSETNFVMCVEKTKDKYLLLLTSLVNQITEKRLHWQQEKLCLNFLYTLSVQEPKYPPSLINVILDYLLHDNIHLRQPSSR